MSKYFHSKWTSVEKISGWRHYEVRNVLNRTKQLELFAVCDKKISITVDLKEILNKEKWIPGWKEII